MIVRVKETFWFQGLLLRAAEINKGLSPNLIHSFQFIIFWKHPNGKECSGVFVGLRNWIYQGNFNLPGNFAQKQKDKKYPNQN